MNKPPRARLNQRCHLQPQSFGTLSTGFWISQAIAVAAELGDC